MNPITDHTRQGTIGELLVQLRLLQFEIQASFPLNDSGNDLIAFRSNVARTLQVKTKLRFNQKGKVVLKRQKLIRRDFDILALVVLNIDTTDELTDLRVDGCETYFMSKTVAVERSTFSKKYLGNFYGTSGHVASLFD